MNRRRREDKQVYTAACVLEAEVIDSGAMNEKDEASVWRVVAAPRPERSCLRRGGNTENTVSYPRPEIEPTQWDRKQSKGDVNRPYVHLPCPRQSHGPLSYCCYAGQALRSVHTCSPYFKTVADLPLYIFKQWVLIKACSSFLAGEHCFFSEVRIINSTQ